MAEPSIHWGGGLSYPIRRGIVTMARGYPCCCSGDRARKVRQDGTQTWDRAEVTCKTCLKLLAKADDAAQASRGLLAPGGAHG